MQLNQILLFAYLQGRSSEAHTRHKIISGGIEHRSKEIEMF